MCGRYEYRSGEGRAMSKNYDVFFSLRPKHLQRYADESAFRLSTFEMKEGERFDLSLAGLEGSLTYAELIGSPEWCV